MEEKKIKRLLNESANNKIKGKYIINTKIIYK